MIDSDIMRETIRKAKRLVKAVIGITVVICGVLLIFLPGPAFIVIPAGLAILATEFAWARKLLRKARKEIDDVRRGR